MGYFFVYLFFLSLPALAGPLDSARPLQDQAKNKGAITIHPLGSRSFSSHPLSPTDLDQEAFQKPAKGLILAFKVWPLNEQNKNALLKKTTALGLKEKVSYSRFKTYVFEWEGWHEKSTALKACKSLLNFPDLDYCEPDLLQKPNMGKIRKKANKKAHRRTLKKTGERWSKELGTRQEEPQSDIKLNPQETFSSDQSGNIRSCKIVSSEVGLLGGNLSDYWAQEMIGSDLMREELKLQPPVKKHLVAVFDTPHYSSRHDIASKHIISHEGKQAVLPNIGNSITNFNDTLSSYGLKHSHYLLNTAKNRCESQRSKPVGTSQPKPGAAR